MAVFYSLLIFILMSGFAMLTLNISVYQLPAFMLKGLVLVVTPLLSLMKDQLKNLPSCLPGEFAALFRSIC